MWLDYFYEAFCNEKIKYFLYILTGLLDQIKQMSGLLICQSKFCILLEALIKSFRDYENLKI